MDAGLSTFLKTQVYDSEDIEDQTEVLIQFSEELEAFEKAHGYGTYKTYLTLEGLQITKDVEWDGEQGVSVYGDSGETVKFIVGYELMSKGKTSFYFKTPMIYGDLEISESGLIWTVDLEEERNCAEYYICQEEELKERKKAKKVVRIYYQWVKTQKTALHKILKELGIKGKIEIKVNEIISSLLECSEE